MRPVHSFLIEPALPPALAGLTRLAKNVRWTWDAPTRELFERLDPHLWSACSHDPLRLLEAISPSRWDALANDAGVVEHVTQISARLDATQGPQWFQHRSGSPLDLVAYFSPEFGLSETLAQYSGGLGILAGDHLKSASDLGIPLVAIGLLYHEGYFRQRLNADGWQVERYPAQDPAGLALTATGVQFTLDLAGEAVSVQVWRVDVGRVPLYVLDTNLAVNSPEARTITDRLYGGDSEHRLRQEILLGMGGVKALRALGMQPQVYHMNEGHAGFLALERIREHVRGGLDFGEAVEAVRAGGVFTTHTPVPAGIDRFAPDLMAKYFTSFAADCNITMDQLMAFGRRSDEADDPRFNMAVLGLRVAARANGVAALHGEVSRGMFGGLWPDLPVEEVPIGSVTNGVHARTWVAPRTAALFDRSFDGIWDGGDRELWDRAHHIDAREVWDIRSQGRRELVDFVRSRLGGELLHPEALTIGFARRFATYKRATLLVLEPERLRALLTNRDRPVQFVFAGKAHPADEPGKQMIQGIERFRREYGVEARFVFVPDYDMAIARMLYAGADVWLNNPRRPLEACGTSGMKAALNGALNCSILDGWWDEAYDTSNGWAIDSYEDDPDTARRDRREAASLFGLLENEIVPMFYDRSPEGVPHGWVGRIRHNWATIAPRFTAARMVRDYTTEYYEPAAAGNRAANESNQAVARELAQWKLRVRAAWDNLKVLSVEATADHVDALIELDGLHAGDVLVQIVHGPTGVDGEFTSRSVVTLNADPQTVGGPVRFSGSYEPTSAGSYGCTIRLMPSHPNLANPVELGLVTWA